MPGWDLCCFMHSNNSLILSIKTLSCFTNKDYGFILTEDLRIIDNNQLRKRSVRELKYRQCIQKDFEQTRFGLVSILKFFINN